MGRLPDGGASIAAAVATTRGMGQRFYWIRRVVFRFDLVAREDDVVDVPE